MFKKKRLALCIASALQNSANHKRERQLEKRISELWRGNKVFAGDKK